MNEIKCAIVDDEPLAREGLADYCADIPFLQLVGTCKNALEALQLLQSEKIDLLFLDINMPRLSGMEFLKTLTHPPAVIFTTAYREFAIEAFENNAIDYLVKPISFQRFLGAANKAKTHLQLSSTVTEIQENDSFFIKQDGQYLRIFFKDILYIEGLKDYIFIYTAERRYMALISMKSAEEQLPAGKFYRVHRSFIVALDKIERLEGNVIFVGKKEIPIGKAQREDIFAKIVNNNLWRR